MQKAGGLAKGREAVNPSAQEVLCSQDCWNPTPSSGSPITGMRTLSWPPSSESGRVESLPLQWLGDHVLLVLTPADSQIQKQVSDQGRAEPQRERF